MSSRLYRTLESVPKPLFDVTSESFSLNDGNIIEMSVNHGSDSPDTGIQPSTATVKTTRSAWTWAGDDISIRLTDAAAAHIAARVGKPADVIKDRFNGRIGRQTNDDTAKRVMATFECASWSAQLSRITTPFNALANRNVSYVVENLLKPASLGGKIAVSIWGSSGSQTAIAIPAANASDDLDSLTSEIGYIARDTRSGTVDLISLLTLRSWSLSRVSSEWPLTRGQALTPAVWEQPNELMARRHRAEYIDADGVVQAISRGGTLESETVDHDWKHIKFTSLNWDLHFSALVVRDYERGFTLPSIKVDLLMLWKMGTEAMLNTMGSILALNRFDSINLSGDWATQVRGVHIVTGLDETITPQSWTVELSLVPWRYMFGDTTPVVPAREWDSAYLEWDQETKSWETA